MQFDPRKNSCNLPKITIKKGGLKPASIKLYKKIKELQIHRLPLYKPHQRLLAPGIWGQS